MGPTGNEMVSDNQESATEATAVNQEESHKKAWGTLFFFCFVFLFSCKQQDIEDSFF